MFTREKTEHSASTRLLQAFTLRQELAVTLRLGVPLALGELGWMSTYIVDALMVGRLPNSALPIAASSLGNTIFYAIVFAAIYLLNGLETLIAQAYGRGEKQECVHLLVQSVWIVAAATPVVMLATLGGLALLPHFGTGADIVAEAGHYMRPLIWSTLPLMGYMALRRYLQSINHVALISFSLITASLVNWAADWALIFGHLGAPAMGIAGSAWATCIVRVYMLTLLVGGTAWAMWTNGNSVEASMLLPNKRRLKELLRIGWPSGLECLEEFGVSAFMSILCSQFGATLLAAHQVVLDLNAFIYQVPNGLSYATVIRVGQSAGRNNLPEVRRATRAGLLLGLGFMLSAATVFAVFSRFWAGLYTNSPAVVRASAPIFLICGFLLMGDTTFTFLASALTGLGDTKTPLIVSLLWNWAIGMPLGYFLAFHEGYALKGLWLGRAAGSVGGGLTLAALWLLRMRTAEQKGSSRHLDLMTEVGTV